MTRYEMLLLANPEITEDEITTFEKHYEKLLKESKGSVISFEKWGKCKLAYPVNKNEYGIYFLTRFEINAPQVFFKEMKLAFDVKYHETIMRHVIVKLDPKGSLHYERPDTVETIQTRNVDQFLKENKMEGLLNSRNNFSNAHNDENNQEFESDEEGIQA